MNIGRRNSNGISFVFYCFLILFLLVFKSPLIAEINYTNLLFISEKNYVLSPVSPDTNNKKDITDLIGISSPDDSNKIKEGLGPFFSIIAAPGYTYSTGFLASLITNICFYSDKNKDKLSSISPCLYYSQYNQFWTTINSLIYLEKPKINLIGEWKFYKYPTRTYGLGALTTPTDGFPIDYTRLLINQIATYKILKNTYVGVGYNLDYFWNISEKNYVGTPTAFDKYGFTYSSFSQGLSLCFLYDSRKNHNNPEDAQYCNIQYRDYALFLGSDKAWQLLNIDLREYVNFPFETRNIIALWSYTSLNVNGDPPYLELPYTASDNNNNLGRGYVQGRYRGKDLLYFETEYRYVITRNGLLGGVVFGNIQSYPNEGPSNPLNGIIPAYGLGLRVKFNKKLNINIAIDYGIGIKGSNGLFFNLGDVF